MRFACWQPICVAYIFCIFMVHVWRTCEQRDRMCGPFHALMQVTFFLAMAVSGRLGTATLAAHQVVAQLWLLTSYVVDGFAVAGTVLGSRLAPIGPGAQSKDPKCVLHTPCKTHTSLSEIHMRHGHVITALTWSRIK